MLLQKLVSSSINTRPALEAELPSEWGSLAGVCRVCTHSLFCVTNLVVCRSESRQGQGSDMRSPKARVMVGSHLGCRSGKNPLGSGGAIGWIQFPVVTGLRSVSAGTLSAPRGSSVFETLSNELSSFHKLLQHPVLLSEGTCDWIRWTP